METHLFVLIISSSVLIIGCFISYVNYVVDDTGMRTEIDLAVCILSARENFDFRNAIRKTWLSDFSEPVGKQNMSLVAKFIVGSRPCHIHPDHRIDSHSCRAWNPELPANPTDELASFASNSRTKDPGACPLTSISFLVMQDIALKRIGVPELFPFDGDDVQVVLYDTVSMEEISRSRFFSSQKASIFQGFKYRPVEEMILPKGYQFTLKLEVSALDNLPRVVENIYEGNSSRFMGGEGHYGLLYVQSVTSVVTSLQSTCSLLEPLMSLMFAIPDTSMLEDLIKGKVLRTEEWNGQKSTESALLEQEVTQHGDVVMVDMVDVYRNLPTKLLHCHQWLSDNYRPQFVMKTDDDVYVNTNNILSGLAGVDARKPVWWGSFRDGWRVERHGKWREDQYTDEVYPDFACGSGNVVSAPVHQMLVNNIDAFRKFQGEDVSMGIWLSPFQVTYIHDSRWRCDKTCTRDFMTLPQLDIADLLWYRNNSLYCHDICQQCS